MAYYQTPYYGYYPQTQPMIPVIYPQQTQLVEQQPTMFPTQMSGTSQSVPEHTNDSYMVWVQGKAGAQSYPVARGTTLPLFDSEGDYVYIKSVDSNGVPLPLVTKLLSDPPVEEKTTVIDTSTYVTKEKYEDLQKKYSELENRILELETKPSLGFTSTFTGNTFNNNRKEKDDGNKLTV